MVPVTKIYSLFPYTQTAIYFSIIGIVVNN